jgi:hypothetical protein
LLPFHPEPFVFSSAAKSIKIRMYKTVILPVILYRCETWSPTLREEYRLRVFENMVLRRIFELKRDEVTGGWRKLHNEEFHNLHSSQSTIRMTMSRRKEDEMGRACSTNGAKRNAKPEGKTTKKTKT